MKKLCIKTIVLVATVLLAIPIGNTGGTTTPPIKNGGGPLLPSYISKI
jgi:hypothetical protein